jgi:ATP-dependent Clp protease ATP-binding subunit ClpA
MTLEGLRKAKEAMARQVLGHQKALDEITKALADKKVPASIILAGPPGTGKTAMVKRIAEMFQDAVIFNPLTPEQLGEIADKMVDRHASLPDACKDEAKKIVRDVIASGHDTSQGARSIDRLVDDLASVATEADMRSALMEKYPVYGQRISVDSGRALAESFTSGTVGETRARKPLKLRSGRVGFFALH